MKRLFISSFSKDTEELLEDVIFEFSPIVGLGKNCETIFINSMARSIDFCFYSRGKNKNCIVEF